jgi:hypothetical protein
MDWEDFLDWLNWSLLVASFIAVVLTALIALVVFVYKAIECVRGHGVKPPPPSIEELLGSIPDVAYRELPPGPGEEGDDDERGRDSCVICVAPYEAGEACSVLPGCAHMFHKPCVAKWLRKKNTCPLCRAGVAVGLLRQRCGEHGVV